MDTYTLELVQETDSGLFIIKDFKDNVVKLNDLKQLVQVIDDTFKHEIFRTICVAKHVIDPDAIADLSRSIIDIQDTFYSPERVIDNCVEELQSLPDEYKTGSYLPRWYKQPYYVEVWIEKKTRAPVIDSILNETHNCQIRVVPTGGWRSFTYE